MSTGDIAGEWIDAAKGDDSWGFLSLKNEIGGIEDSFYRVDAGGKLMFRKALDPSNPGRGYRWYEGGTIQKVSDDSLIFFSPQMDRMVRMYKASAPSASKALNIESITFGGNAWNLPYTDIRLEIKKDGEVKFQGIDRSKNVVNRSGRISPALFEEFQHRARLADPTSIKPYYECGCVVGKRDTLAIDYGAGITHTAFYGFDKVPESINGLISLIMRTPTLAKLEDSPSYDYPNLTKRK